jgi:hypothetical protein
MLKHFNFSIGTWTVPAWLTLILTTIAASLATYAMAIPPADYLTDITTTAGLLALGKGALVAVLVALVNLAKTQLTPADARAKALLIKSAAKTLTTLVMAFAFILVCASLMGCGTFLSATPTVPVTPANAAQVSSCESTATGHNLGAIGALTLAGGSAVVGVVDSQESSAKTQQTLGWVTAGIAALAAVDTMFTSIESANYAQSQCSSLLGPLPVATPQKPAALIWHLDPPGDGARWNDSATAGAR